MCGGVVGAVANVAVATIGVAVAKGVKRFELLDADDEPSDTNGVRTETFGATGSLETLSAVRLFGAVTAEENGPVECLSR